MITLYVTTASESCRKARKWLQENAIPFKERNIKQHPLASAEIYKLLQLSDNGTEEILSKTSPIIQKSNLDSVHLSELCQMIREHPTILRRPIICDEKQLMVGYNAFQIRRFIPKNTRMLERRALAQLYT